MKRRVERPFSRPYTVCTYFLSLLAGEKTERYLADAMML